MGPLIIYRNVCEQFGVVLVNHSCSKGNGAATKSGARLVNGNALVFMDADTQHDPEI